MSKIPFIQYVINIFEFLLKDSEERTIDLDLIPTYLELVNDEYNKRCIEHGLEENTIDFEIKDEVVNIICSYPNIFYLEDNNLCLYDQVTFEDIHQLKSTPDFNGNYSLNIGDFIEVFKLLKTRPKEIDAEEKNVIRRLIKKDD